MLSQALLGPLVDVLTLIENLGGLEWEGGASVNPCEASSSERTGVSLSSLRGGWVGEDGRKKERRSSQYYPRCAREPLVSWIGHLGKSQVR